MTPSMTDLHTLISCRRGTNVPLEDTVTRFEIVHQMAASHEDFSLTIMSLSMFLIRSVEATFQETYHMFRPFDQWPRTILDFEMLKLSLRGIPNRGLIHDRLPLYGSSPDYVPISRSSLPEYNLLENLATRTESPVVYRIGDEVDYYQSFEYIHLPRTSVEPHIVSCVDHVSRGEITLQTRSRISGEVISIVTNLRNVRRNTWDRAFLA